MRKFLFLALLATAGLAQAETRYVTDQLEATLRTGESVTHRITRMLDQMAAIVIYSRTSFTEPPYRVQPGDTLEKIAETYGVPAELLAKINGIRDPLHFQPGQELKVVRGPFSALVEAQLEAMALRRDWRPRWWAMDCCSR